ncbi:MAG: hypothetical protein AB1394_07675 [Bacteroidota bacterium]
MITSQSELTLKLNVQRLTALWGFSEAALGGILHILKIPLTGLLIGGAAVFFISLIARYAESPSQILKSTLVVILIKAVVTPFIPLNSYFAVTVQGIMGYLFFSFIPYYKVSAILLGMIALTLSAFQKLFVITFVFGSAFWDSIDTFVNFLITQHPFLKSIHSLKASVIIISVYASIHLLAGLLIGIKAARVDKWLERKSKMIDLELFKSAAANPFFDQKTSSKRKRWWQRKSGILLIIFFLALMILSYLVPKIEKSTASDILYMIIRSVAITFIWFKFITPFVLSRFKRFIEKRKFDHAAEINKITALFPSFKKVINYCWEETYELSGLRRILTFLSNSLAMLLILEINNEQTQHTNR